MEMASMAILKGWPHQLKTASRANQGIMILDQGPVYMLSELLKYSSPDFRTAASKWWQRVCNDWANVLDMVICLDTADVILTERVRARETRHQIKGNSDQWAEQFLARSRESQSYVLKSMTDKCGTVKVIQIDTSHVSLRETVQRIFTLLDEDKKIK
jgi:hypothetical protein